jgi:biopolymer transport protein ExbB
MRKFSFLRFAVFAIILAAVVFLAAGGIAADAPPPGGGAAAQVKIHVNPFALVKDNIDFVFIIVLLCSIVGLTLIIQGFIKARAEVMFPDASTNHIRDLISQKQFKELIEFTETDPSFISKALNPALKRAPSFAAMKEAMETAIGEQTAEHFRKIEYLNIIGNLGPLLGLLGTVLGMIDSFQQMSLQSGDTSPAVLAGGISKALCHTMLGLMLALPCLAAFGVLRTFIDRLTVQGALIAEELLLMVKPQEAKPAATAAVPGPAKPAMPGMPGIPGVPPMPGLPPVRKAPAPGGLPQQG